MKNTKTEAQFCFSLREPHLLPEDGGPAGEQPGIPHQAVPPDQALPAPVLQALQLSAQLQHRPCRDSLQQLQ